MLVRPPNRHPDTDGSSATSLFRRFFSGGQTPPGKARLEPVGIGGKIGLASDLRRFAGARRAQSESRYGQSHCGCAGACRWANSSPKPNGCPNPGAEFFNCRVGRVTPCAPLFANERVLVHHDGARGAARPTSLVSTARLHRQSRHLSCPHGLVH